MTWPPFGRVLTHARDAASGGLLLRQAQRGSSCVQSGRPAGGATTLSEWLIAHRRRAEPQRDALYLAVED